MRESVSWGAQGFPERRDFVWLEVHLNWGHPPLCHLGKGMWQRALYLLGTGQEHCLMPDSAQEGSCSGEILPQLRFLSPVLWFE